MSNVSKFDAFRSDFLKQAAVGVRPEAVALASDIFLKTHTFLSENNLTTNAASPGMETLTTIPRLIVNRKDDYSSVSIEALSDFLKECKVPEDTRVSCAVEVARILSGANEDTSTFYDRGRANSKHMPLRQIYSAQSIAMINGHQTQALESFGEYSDRVTSDSRLSVALTVLRAHMSLIDRALPRKAAEDPVVIIKIPSPEVYNLDQSQNLVAANRYGNGVRQPLIELYRDPSMVNTQPQLITPLKVNDNGSPAYLVADNIIAAGQKVNLFDMTLMANTVGYTAVDWTDLVSDGGSVGSVLVAVTVTVPGSPAVVTTEEFVLPTQYLRNAQFTTQTNVQDSGERAANIRAKFNLTAGSLQASGTVSSLLASFTNVNLLLELNFNATLNIKTSYVDGSGGLTGSLQSTLSSIPSGVQTEFGEMTFAVVGWSPFLFFSEENMRKTTGAIRMNYKEQEFLIPVGRNFIVDYSLMGQEIGDEVTNVVSEVIGVGNSARSVGIIQNTLTSVNARLQQELANPDIDYYNSVAQDYAAGTLSLPHTYVGSLNVNLSSVMRESERLSDLHSYITSRLLAIIADAHNKSMYTENFEAGERARYKVITSGPIGDVLFGITQYWNTLDDKVQVAEKSDYSLKLPNGTQLDIIKSNFEVFENTMMIIPVREAKPEDVTSFGVVLDRGTFVGQYTPVSNGAANKRIVANSREILFPTNPLGFLITVTGLATQLQILTDGPGLME